MPFVEIVDISRQASKANSVELTGHWVSFVERRMFITIRVESVRVTSKHKKHTAEYQVTKLPLLSEASEIAAWRFHKTIPDVEDYTVVLRRDGSCTCDCKYASFAAIDRPTVCVHVSAVMTLADTFKELVLPAP